MTRWTIAFGAAALVTVMAAQDAPPQASPEALALMTQATSAAYNLDHADAIALARRAAALDPNSSAPHRIAAWVIWNQILFLRGAITVDYYLGGVTKSQATIPKPPQDLVAEFHGQLDRAIAIAEARVRQNKRDVTAEYDLGAAYGVQASYAASVDAKITAAFGSARHAFDAHERVLELAPTRADAGLIVGTYRYIVSGLALPVRLFAYMVGFGGGKERGIGMIEAAARRTDSAEDAEIALVLIYTREGRHADALAMVRDIERRLPRNRLFVLEEGSTLLRMGRAAEAEAVLTSGLARLDADPRPRGFSEHALWLYKRGAARVALRRTDAAADLRAALADGPVGWVEGRVHVELGKLADVAKDRLRALAEYRQASTICAQNNDAVCQSEADRLIKRPFGT